MQSNACHLVKGGADVGTALEVCGLLLRHAAEKSA